MGNINADVKSQAVSGATFIIVHTDEAVEDFFCLFRGHAASGVGNSKVNESFFIALAAANLDFSFDSSFARIGNHIYQNLLHPHRIGENVEIVFELGREIEVYAVWYPHHTTGYGFVAYPVNGGFHRAEFENVVFYVRYAQNIINKHCQKFSAALYIIGILCFLFF